MAKATTEVRTHLAVTEVKEDVIQLTLSITEARALAALAGFVFGGNDTYAAQIRDIREVLFSTAKLGFVPTSSFFIADDEGDLRARTRAPQDK